MPAFVVVDRIQDLFSEFAVRAFPDYVDTVMREVRMAGSNCYGHAGARRDFDIALGLLRTHRDALRTLVTHTFPLEGINDAFAAASDKSTGSIKVRVDIDRG